MLLQKNESKKQDQRGTKKRLEVIDVRYIDCEVNACFRTHQSEYTTCMRLRANQLHFNRAVKNCLRDICTAR